MSLQFHSPSGYFSSLARWSAAWALAGAILGCGERDRLTFPVENPGNGSGPQTTITRPEVADTLLAAGEAFTLTGLSADPDGVDVVRFQVVGAGVSFGPLDGGGADTVRFSIDLPTLGHSGDTILVQIFGVDAVGDLGPTATRQIRVQ